MTLSGESVDRITSVHASGADLQFALCLHCGYSLRGLPEARCPECGEAFDPLDPLTFRDSRRCEEMRRTHRREWAACAAPPTWAETILVSAVTVWVLVDASRELFANPFGRLGMRAEGVRAATLCFLGLVFFIRALASLVEWLRPEPRISAPRMSGCSRWIVTIVSFVLLFSTPQLQIQLRTFAWDHSFSALEARAQEMLRNPVTQNQPTRVGWLRVRRIAVLGDGRVKFQMGSGWALVFDPANRNPDVNLPRGWSILSW